MPGFGFHGLDLVVILVIALLIFGPKKLPEMGSAIGKSIKEFRKGVSELTAPKDEHAEENQLPATATELPSTATDMSKLNATAVESDAHIKETTTTSEVKGTEVKID
jgi:sec-independent protein translocase protein TatA